MAKQNMYNNSIIMCFLPSSSQAHCWYGKPTLWLTILNARSDSAVTRSEKSSINTNRKCLFRYSVYLSNKPKMNIVRHPKAPENAVSKF